MYKLADNSGWVGDHGKLAEGEESDEEDRPRYVEELGEGGAEVRVFTGGFVRLADGDEEKRAAAIARRRAKEGEADGDSGEAFEIGDTVMWVSEDYDIEKGTVGEVARVGLDGKLKVLFRKQLWSFWPKQLVRATEQDIANTATRMRPFGKDPLPFTSRVIKELKVGMSVVKNTDKGRGCDWIAEVGQVVEVEQDGADTIAVVKFAEQRRWLGTEEDTQDLFTEKLAQHYLLKPLPMQLMYSQHTEAELAARFEQRQAALRQWRAARAGGDPSHEVASWGPQKPSDPSIVGLIGELQAKGEQFEDPDFDVEHMEKTLPAQAKHKIMTSPELKEWKRPGDVAPEYTIWHRDTGLPHCSEMSQGEVSNCWFISAVATLAAARPLLLKHRFCGCYPEIGCYVVSFFKRGEWVEVVIDDRLLTYRGRPLLAHDKIGADGWDFWLPLLEKAYAKLHGGYASLEHGRMEDALIDLAGALPVRLSPQADQGEAILARFAQCEARGVTPLLGVSSNTQEAGESGLGTGLTSNHAYAVLELIDKRDEGLPLLLLCRNPYGSLGHAGGYNGPWSNDSDLWTEETEDILGFKPSDLSIDGRFLITWTDAVKHMTTWRYSVLLPSDFFRIKLEGEWDTSSAGGGSRPERMATNPQFLLRVPEPPAGMQFFGQLSLEQEDYRWSQQQAGREGEEFFIGIRVYKTEGRARLPASRFESAATLSSGPHQQARMVCCMLDRVEPGEYVVVPQTRKDSLCGKFVLGVWVSYAVDLEPLPPPVTPVGSAMNCIKCMRSGQFAPAETSEE